MKQMTQSWFKVFPKMTFFGLKNHKTGLDIKHIKAEAIHKIYETKLDTKLGD
jgi:hypothetical protein